MRNERGFTILEVVISATIFALILAGVSTAIGRDAETNRVIVGQLGPEMKARAAIERIVSELRMAGLWGEDKNHDGILDPGEDSNGNGILDANWSLADGTTDAHSLTFNKRMDETDNTGRIIASGIYSRAITYSLSGDRLLRRWTYTDVGGHPQTRVSVLATGVSGLHFARKGTLVVIKIDVKLPPRVYKTDTKTYTARVRLRN